jgi:fructose-bisphosphate aldolase class I
MKDAAQKLVTAPRGILAADSTKGIIKRFEGVGLTFSPELDKKYKEIILGTPGLEQFISGVILNDTNIRQNIPVNSEIALGIKVDGGLEPFGEGIEEVTKGLSGLEQRLKEYLMMGAKFTKWRGVFRISDITPTDSFLEENLGRMVDFARISQSAGFVSIVEPEILLDGNHTTTRCEEIETKVLKVLFEKLKSSGVDLTSLILKTSMVLPGKDNGVKAAPLEVAKVTVRTLKNSVSPEVAGVVFLSGGQSADDAADNLNEIEKNLDGLMFPVSFSFERGLQEEVLRVWSGKDENIKLAQEAFINRAREVSLAREGKLI